MLFSEFLGREISFHDVKNKEQIIDNLDSKMKNPELDPDKKWILEWLSWCTHTNCKVLLSNETIY